MPKQLNEVVYTLVGHALVGGTWIRARLIHEECHQYRYPSSYIYLQLEQTPRQRIMRHNRTLVDFVNDNEEENSLLIHINRMRWIRNNDHRSCNERLEDFQHGKYAVVKFCYELSGV